MRHRCWLVWVGDLRTKTGTSSKWASLLYAPADRRTHEYHQVYCQSHCYSGGCDAYPIAMGITLFSQLYSCGFRFVFRPMLHTSGGLLSDQNSDRHRVLQDVDHEFCGLHPPAYRRMAHRKGHYPEAITARFYQVLT